MTQPLAYLFKQIQLRTGAEYQLYHLWGSFDATVLDRERSNRAPTATAYMKMVPRKLVRKLFPGCAQDDVQAIADRVLAVASNCDTNAEPVRDEVPNALGLLVEGVFRNAFNQALYDDDRPYAAEEVLYRLRDESALSFMWEMPFKRMFSSYLQAAFPEASDNMVELFWDEYDQLLLVPIVPTADRLNELDMEDQRREMKGNLVLHVALLVMAALLGPGLYFKNFGLVPPASNVTMPYGFKPAKVASAGSARLQPVIMIGNGPAAYYTDTTSDPFALDAASGPLVFGRDPVAVGGQAVKIKSALQNVSRQHAQLAYDPHAGWTLHDIGTDNEGSSWGTLVLYSAGGSAYLVGEETLLHHGDIICFAPELRERLDGTAVTPTLGVDDLCFRFEETEPPKRR